MYATSASFENLGSIRYYSGILAQTLGRTREAACHLAQAVERNQRAGLSAWAARSQYTLAKLLDACGREPARAQLLLTAAAETAQRLGLVSLTQAIQAAD